MGVAGVWLSTVAHCVFAGPSARWWAAGSSQLAVNDDGGTWAGKIKGTGNSHRQKE